MYPWARCNLHTQRELPHANACSWYNLPYCEAHVATLPIVWTKLAKMPLLFHKLENNQRDNKTLFTAFWQLLYIWNFCFTLKLLTYRNKIASVESGDIQISASAKICTRSQFQIVIHFGENSWHAMKNLQKLLVCFNQFNVLIIEKL